VVEGLGLRRIEVSIFFGGFYFHHSRYAALFHSTTINTLSTPAMAWRMAPSKSLMPWVGRKVGIEGGCMLILVSSWLGSWVDW